MRIERKIKAEKEKRDKQTKKEKKESEIRALKQRTNDVMLEELKSLKEKQENERKHISQYQDKLLKSWQNKVFA